MQESRMKMVMMMSRCGNSGDFERDFLNVKKESEKRGFLYIISIIKSKGKKLGGSFMYEFFVGDCVYSIEYENLLKMEYIYDVANEKYIDKQDFLEEYVRRLLEDKKRNMIDRILVDFLSGKLSQ